MKVTWFGKTENQIDTFACKNNVGQLAEPPCVASYTFSAVKIKLKW